MRNLPRRFPFRQAHPVMLSAAMMAGAVIGSQAALALDQSKLPQGANHEKAHAKATGKGVNIGIIEDSGGIRPQNNLGARLLGQFDFAGLTPGQAPAVLAAGTGTNHHTTLVADTAAGGVFNNTVGVAKGANVYFGGMGTAANSDAEFYDGLRTATDWLRRNRNVSLFNMSARVDLAFNNNNGANNSALYADWFMKQNDALIVKSAGNNGGGFGDGSSQITTPGDFFNGITVGASTNNFQARADYSSYRLSPDTGAAPDIRGKPDILAPGTLISDGKSYPGPAPALCPGEPALSCSGTSFAAPHVTGVAAMLMEKGLGLPGPTLDNHQAIKAIIMNSARKRGVNPPENGFRIAEDDPGSDMQPSDSNYLSGLGLTGNIPFGTVRVGGTPAVPRTREWTPTNWTYDGNVLRVRSPLDDEQGTGMLDAERAMIQFDGEEQEEQADNPGGITPIGWNRDSVGPNDAYFFDFALDKSRFITATLVWDRPVLEHDQGTTPCDPNLGPLPATCGVVNTADTYVAGALPDLNLSIFFKGTLLATSNSVGENVEHLHFPVPFYGAARDYEIRVEFAGADPFNYALAWWTVVPVPGTLLLVLAALPGLLPLRRRLRSVAVA